MRSAFHIAKRFVANRLQPGDTQNNDFVSNLTCH